MKNIYVCGPTVYSEPHIGNMRTILIFDIVIRSLRFKEEDVIFIHNITDIDDKIILKAKNEGLSEVEISSKYRKQYEEFLEKFNVQKPTYMPSVVENIDLIIDFISKMINNGNAYVKNGNVYFDILSIVGYGKLSNRKIEDMYHEHSDDKKNLGDFALWKKTNQGVSFSSPWGQGRPGWHTECSTFISKYLNGESLDIHGGGIDLLFPHHENENIQYKSIFNKNISKEWKHVGHLNFENQKMSKSLGNLILVSDFIKKYSVDTLRYIFLVTSYSSPINLSESIINNAVEMVKKFEKSFTRANLIFNNFSKHSNLLISVADDIVNFNFSKAMKKVNEIFKNFNKYFDILNASDVINVSKLLGFSFSNKIIEENDKVIYREWEIAKKNKNFELADKLKNRMKNLGIF